MGSSSSVPKRKYAPGHSESRSSSGPGDPAMAPKPNGSMKMPTLNRSSSWKHEEVVRAWADTIRFQDLMLEAVAQVYPQNLRRKHDIALLESDTVDRLCEKMCQNLKEKVHQSVRQQRASLGLTKQNSQRWEKKKSTDSTPSSSSGQVMDGQNPKFAFEGNFGDLHMYYCGLDGRIGLPQPKVLEAMEKEHLHHAEATEEFVTSNYGGTRTNIQQEWNFVVNPDLNNAYPGFRRGRPLQTFLDHPNSKRAGLTFEEIVALRLFTGPMFMHYNQDLRAEDHEHRGFVTTIHAIVSGVNKLMRIWELPANRKVYRGLQGITLPKQFWEPDECFCRGGVEMGLMSCTPRREVAIQYTQSGTSAVPTLFEIEVGQVDKGAVVSWLSQYPDEEEVLLPPLCNLEVVGIPSHENIERHQVLVVKLRLNVNLKNLTLEEIQERRKVNHLALLKNLTNETRRDLSNTTPCQAKALNEAKVEFESFFEELKVNYREMDLKPAHWYNDDEHYREAVSNALDLKIGVERKFKHLLELAQCSSIQTSGALCQLSYKDTLTKAIIDSHPGRFTRPGHLYCLRSGTEAVPWDAIAEEKLTELVIPSGLTMFQAEIVWECVFSRKNPLTSIKIQAGDKYLEVPLTSILGSERQALSGFAIGGSGLQTLLPAMGFNTRITELDLSSAMIGDEGCTRLSEVLAKVGQGLKVLNLFHNRVGDSGVGAITDALVNFTSLESLNLASNVFGGTSGHHLRDLFLAHRGLTNVDLSWSNVGPGMNDMTVGLQVLTSLTTLDLSQVWLGPEGMTALAPALRQMEKLQVLHSTISSIQDEGAKVMASVLPSLKNLKIVPIVDYDCTKVGSKHLCEAIESLPLKFGVCKGRVGMTDEIFQTFCKKLQGCELMMINIGEFPHLSDEAFESLLSLMCKPTIKDVTVTLMNFSRTELHLYIESLTYSNSITKLHLCSNNLTEHGVQALARAMKNLENLVDLDLHSNDMKSAGCSALLPVVRRNTGLKRLIVNNNNIGDKGFEILTEALQNAANLEILGCSYNRIKHKITCLPLLFRSTPSLRNLNCSGNDFGSFGVTTLMDCCDVVDVKQNLEILDFSCCGFSTMVADRLSRRFGKNVSMVA